MCAVRTGEDLAAVVGALVDDPRHLFVRIVEHLAEQEDGTLDRRELLEQVQERERERIGGLGVTDRLVVDQRLGQPLARIDLAASPRRAELIDRQARRDRRQVGLRRVRLDLGLVVAQERVLDDVLRLGDRAEHPVGDREQIRPQLVVSLHHCAKTE